MIRLNKYLSQKGVCSRRQADDWIKKGWITVNGSVAEIGMSITDSDHVKVRSLAHALNRSKKTILFNKPLGIVSCQPEKGYKQAKSFLTIDRKHGKRPGTLDPNHFHVAGRLDIDSRGALILTQDGRVAKAIIGEDSLVEKEYIVTTDKQINPDMVRKLSHGLCLDGKRLKPAMISLLKPNVMKMILQEGKKRQIRRMCQLVGLNVLTLTRVRVGSVLLKDLPEGKWRYLSSSEVSSFLKR